MRLQQRHSKGQVLVLLALTMLMLLAVIALAIDIGRAYGVKAKLNAAVDAASFEAANSLAEGDGESGMKARAEVVAKEFFAANYRLEFLGTKPPVPAVTAERDAMGKWKVRVAATAEMPTFFAGLLGFSTLDVTAVSETVRGTLDMVLVLDTSESMKNNNQIEDVKTRAEDFISKFDELDDRIGLVAYASGAATVVSLCGSTSADKNPAPQSMICDRGFKKREILHPAINALQPGGMTASEEGLKKALNQHKGLDKDRVSGHRAIVFFSDGAPNTLNGKFLLKGGGYAEGNLYSGVYHADLPRYIYEPSTINSSPTDYVDAVIGLPEKDLSGDIPVAGKRPLTEGLLKCNANAAARNMTENIASMARKEGIAVYSIGLGKELMKEQMFDESCSTNKEFGTVVLKRVANTPDSDTYDPTQPTGIFCLAQDVAGLKQCFDRVGNAILRITR